MAKKKAASKGDGMQVPPGKAARKKPPAVKQALDAAYSDQKQLQTELRKCGAVSEKQKGQVVGVALKTKRSVGAIPLLPRATGLKTLNLSRLPLTESSYLPLAELSTLEVLHVVRYGPLPRVGLASVGRIRSLQKLYLSLSQAEDVDPDALVELGQLSELSGLSLSRFRFSNQGGHGLQLLSKLKWLYLPMARNVGIAMEATRNCQSLENLCIYGSDATDEDLERLPSWTNLKELNVYDCERLTSEAALSISRATSL